MRLEPFRVPNVIFYSLAVVVTLASFGVAWYAYPLLPHLVPTHFGVSGIPDAWSAKNIWLVLLPCFVQVFLLAMTGLVMWRPEWANLPTSLALALVPAADKKIIYGLVRHMMVIILIITTLIMAYILLGTISVALGTTPGLNGWMIGGLIVWLLLAIAVYSVWMYRLTKRIADHQSFRSPNV